MTGHHQGPKCKLRVSRPLVSVITTLYYVGKIIFHCRVWYCALSVLCVYSKFGHHPHPLSYLCAKFRFCCSLHCGASPRKKSCTYSITHPAYLMPRKPKRNNASNASPKKPKINTRCNFAGQMAFMSLLGCCDISAPVKHTTM